MTRTKA